MIIAVISSNPMIVFLSIFQLSAAGGCKMISYYFFFNSLVSAAACIKLINNGLGEITVLLYSG